MAKLSLSLADITIQSLTPSNWQDFMQLFSEPGAQRGCWCVYWRTTRQEFQQGYGEGNRLRMQALVDSGTIPGILAYHEGKAVGWCAVAPRAEFASLERSRTLRRVDDLPVWSITCFFISKPYRQYGLSALLIQAAIAYAQQHGARIVEAYPLDVEVARTQPYERYMGLYSTFAELGFKEVARRSPRRFIMRYTVPATQKRSQ